MEKNATEILREIEAEIASLKDRLRALEEKVAECQAVAEAQAEAETEADAAPVDFTDMEIGVDDLPADLPDNLPADLPVPEPEEEVEERPAAPAPDPETASLPWYVDKPGLPVKNIRSGISLYDRSLFIGTLFKEDFALYDKTIADLNALDSLDGAVAYVTEHFPDWNLRSDIVYNFMMAIRKKLG